MAGKKYGRPPKVTPEIITKMQEMRDQGVLSADVAKTFGVSSQTVQRYTAPGRRNYKVHEAPTEDEVRGKLERSIKHGGNNSLVAARIPEDEMSAMIRNVIKWYGRPRIQSDEECGQRLDNFFETIAETGELPTVEKMALALGVNHEQLSRWERGMDGSSPTRQAMIRQAKAALGAIDAELVSNNKIPQVTYIFRSKNFFGMRDQTDVVVTPNNPVGEVISAEEIAEKYKELPEE